MTLQERNFIKKDIEKIKANYKNRLLSSEYIDNIKINLHMETKKRPYKYKTPPVKKVEPKIKQYGHDFKAKDEAAAELLDKLLAERDTMHVLDPNFSKLQHTINILSSRLQDAKIKKTWTNSKK